MYRLTGVVRQEDGRPYAQVVSATRSRSSYHHGALREELLGACVQLIEAEGIGAVSLRRVAREAGVSPGAPYHHFADRAALLAALAEQGFELLGGRMRAARAEAAGPRDALRALVETYVLFAREKPAHFQLMFRPELSHSKKHMEDKAAADSALDVVVQVVVECQRHKVVPPGDAGPFVMTIWALAHGLASLWLDGPLEHTCARLGSSPEELTKQVARALEAALADAAAAHPH